MTLEPDPAAVLVHERLEQAVSSMRAPDVEVGWAALVAQLEAPIAPVVPLRPPARGRFVAFAVAAALMVAGSAFAAVSHVRDTPPDPIAPAVPSVHASGDRAARARTVLGSTRRATTEFPPRHTWRNEARRAVGHR